jgi:hypothetical protein
MKSQLAVNLLAFLFLSLFSCTKETSRETGHTTGPGATGDFYATIDGKLWNADSLQLIQVDNGIVTISGLSKTGEVISMIVPVFKTGTYTLGGLSLSYASYVNLLGDLSKIYASDASNASGTITISSIDTVHHLMNGSFQFNLVDLSDNSIKTITKGVFAYIPYSGGTPLPGQTGADTLTATINGVLFAPPQLIVKTQGGTQGSSLQLLIGGISADGTQRLALLLPADIAAGSYNMDFANGAGNYYAIYYPVTGETLVSASNGTLTIISNNAATRRIKGTFSFTASPLTSGTPATITNGYFSVNY